VSNQWFSFLAAGLYCHGEPSVRPSVRLSVRPFVRPSVNISHKSLLLHSIQPISVLSIYLRQRRSSVCLSVCLLARLLKHAWMDLDEMLRVDRCRDVDELINF